MATRCGTWLALSAALALSGCGSFGFDSFDSWFGEPEAPPLPGERIAILALDQSLEADPKLADLPVRLPRPYANDAWVQAGGVPSHANHHLAAGSAEALQAAWTTSIGTGSDDEHQLTAEPLIVGGRIYTLDVESVVSAFDAADGDRIWRTELMPDEEDGAFGGGLAHADGKIYVSTGFAQVVALNAENGEEIWRVGLGGPMRAAPAVNGDRVFAITIDNQLHAVDANTGEKLWAHSGITEVASLFGGASPATAGGIVVVPYSSGELFALRVENGRPVWSDSLSNIRRIDAVSALADIRGMPVIDRGLVYAVSHSGRMVAIDQRTGSRAWDREIGGTQTPWVAGDFIYVLSNESKLYCLTRDGGRVRWVQTLQRFENEEESKGLIQWTGPVLIGDRLVVAGSHGEAMSVSPYTGELLGRMELPDPVSIAPAVADETLYILTDGGELMALR
jgi:outer membrane protein assembly factor BamB